jgi:hypothetical protein
LNAAKVAWLAACLCFGIWASSPVTRAPWEIAQSCYFAVLGLLAGAYMPHLENFIGRITVRVEPKDKP